MKYVGKLCYLVLEPVWNIIKIILTSGENCFSYMPRQMSGHCITKWAGETKLDPKECQTNKSFLSGNFHRTLIELQWNRLWAWWCPREACSTRVVFVECDIDIKWVSCRHLGGILPQLTEWSHDQSGFSSPNLLNGKRPVSKWLLEEDCAKCAKHELICCETLARSILWSIARWVSEYLSLTS